MAGKITKKDTDGGTGKLKTVEGVEQVEGWIPPEKPSTEPKD